MYDSNVSSYVQGMNAAWLHLILVLFFSAESRILEIHPFYRTTRLAGGDNTLIVLLSILCPQEDSNPYSICRKDKSFPVERWRQFEVENSSVLCKCEYKPL